MRKRKFVTLSVALAAVLAIGGVAIAANGFTDVPEGHIFHDDIQWMADNDITRGCNPPANTNYCPEDNVTRGQMAAFMHRFANHIEGLAGEGIRGPEGPEGPKGDNGEKGDPGEPGQSLIAHAVTDPGDEPPFPGVLAVAVPGGGSGAMPDRDDVIVEVTIPQPGTYKLEGVVQFFDFTSDDDTTEYGYAQTYVGDEIVGSLWTADLPDDGNNGAMASGVQIIETTEPNTTVSVVGVVRGGDGGVAGGNLIVTQFNN